MEIQLQELIEQIKKDGVTAAEEQAATLLAEARQKADTILADANEKAEKTLADAKEEANRLVSVGEEALRQAGRNVILSFRESIAKELEAVTAAQVKEAFSGQAFAELVAKVVLTWAEKEEAGDIAVLLNESDAKALEESLTAALNARLAQGVTVKPNDTFDGGFRIAVNGGRAYYDYSAEAVTDLLSAYLNPRLTALLKEAEGV